MATRAAFVPMVSVITPARSASATLERTFSSVARQSLANWEHIVVTHPDDENTGEVARRRALNDRRVVHLTAARTTAAAARNYALEHARGQFVLFLDADDTVSRPHCSRLVRHAQSTSADIVLTGYKRVGADGTILSRRPARTGSSAAEALSLGPPTALHALLFKRELLNRIGAFDCDLVTNEDWDLCLRAAAQGATFSNVRGWSAEYWTTQGSLSSQAVIMLRDRVKVAGRARRLEEGSEGILNGMDGGAALDAAYSTLWAGALCVARDQDTGPLLSELAAIAQPSRELICAEQGAAALLDGLAVGFGCRHGAIEKMMSDRWKALVRFLSGMARICDDRGLDEALLAALERELGRLGRADRPRWVNESRLLPVLSDMLSPMSQGLNARQIILRLAMVRPRSLATFDFVPALAQGRSPLRLVIARLAAQLDDQLQGSVNVVGRARDLAVRLFVLTRRKLRAVAGRTGAQPRDAEERDPWEQVFETENPWHYHCRYEQAKYERTLALLPDEPIGRALELACAEGHFTQQLAPRVTQLTAADISPTALARCQARCSQAEIGNVDFLELDFFEKPIGAGWDLIVSSEVLYYMASREKLADYASRIVEVLNEGGLFLHAHAYQVSDTPGRSGFDWGDEFAAGTICDTFASTPGLVLERSIESDVYRCELYRKRTSPDAQVPPPASHQVLSIADELDPALASDVIWNGAILSRQDAEEQRKTRVPVLMYHAISETGPAGLAPWRTTPEAFEHQLRFLRRRGYRSIGMDEWNHARGETAALSGRPVVISFDDGYENFAENAWPLLQRNGFGAIQFITTGAVGGRAEWDSRYGNPYQLMDWSTVARLVEEGLEVGSHCHEHRPLDRLTFAEIATDARLSREAFALHLGQVPATVAPPYGICSHAQGEALRAAGFERIFLAAGGMAPVRGPVLRTPRIEVSNGVSIHDFAALVGARDAPEPADLP